MFNNQIIAGAAGQGGSFYSYSIDQSLRLDKASSANLSFTPSSAGSTNTGTISVWLKRTQVGGYQIIYQANGGTYDAVWINTNDNLQVILGSTSTAILGWNRKFRDTGSWGHLVIKLDVSNGTANQRIIAYWNGEDMGAADLSGSTSYPASSAVFGGWFKNAVTQRLNFDGGVTYSDGYWSEMHVIDGTALDATSFGETSNGVWVPKAYSGSYGTNGFYLSFADSAAIGDDLSGNTNDFTATNVAAGDVVLDSPTNNFATWNSLQPQGAAQGTNTLSEGNLKAGNSANAYGQSMGSMSVLSGKWYTETYISDTGFPSWHIGWTYGSRFEAFDGSTNSDEFFAGFGYFTGSQVYFSSFGEGYAALSTAWSGIHTAGDAPTTGDVIGCAADFDNGKFWWSINGEWLNVGSGAGDPANDSNPARTFTVSTYANNYKSPWVMNYNGSFILNAGQDSTFAGAITAGGNSDENGNGDFKYSVPSGFLALCSANLPEPAIGPNSTTTSDQHFNTVLYTGNASTNAITGVNFAPDWVWLKARSFGSGHALFDVVRGALNYIPSQDTTAESSLSGSLTSFDSDGFTLGSNNGVNRSGTTFASWNWKAGGTAVSNTDGSITSSVSANQDAGFSIVIYEGTGSNATVGHGLSAAPELIMIKERDNANGWAVSIKGDPTDFLRLDTTVARSDDAAVFNDTAPTSTVFSIGTAAIVNRDSMIAYCFHSVDGFSKVGSYVGNGSADGTFVALNFRPAFLILRRTDSGNNWHMFDNKRDTFNVVDANLYPNLSNAEATGTAVDFLSNGFKIRSSAAAFNASGGSYIYLAFAEAPFKYANAR